MAPLPPSSGVWASTCRFQELTQNQVLDAVADRVYRLDGSDPLVILDLDSTLYEVGPRTFQILREWVMSQESSRHPGPRRVLEGLTLPQVGYSVRATLESLGLSLADPEVKRAFGGLKGFWERRFFSNEYLKYDRPYPGAAEFSHRLRSLGAGLVYLTGRDEAGMGEGTRANLSRDGFSWRGARLLLKPRSHLSDLDHKTAAARSLSSQGVVVASFENEPTNLVALREIFPNAMHVFVDTVCSDREVRPCHGLYRIQGFR